MQIALERTVFVLLSFERPELAASTRKRGRTTARDYVWEKVIEQLMMRIELAAHRQAVRLAAAGAATWPVARPRARVRRSK